MRGKCIVFPKIASTSGPACLKVFHGSAAKPDIVRGRQDIETCRLLSTLDRSSLGSCGSMCFSIV
jgi:hypothetical protein